MRTSIISLLLASACHATTLTVCASGCGYTSFQTALNTAVGGDIVELKSGETFEGSFSLPFRTDAGVVTVRSSRYAELPAPGNRVGAAHSALMGAIQPSTTSDAALWVSTTEKTVASVDLGTDTLTVTAHGYTDGRPVSFRRNNDGTVPVTVNTVYYVRDSAANTFKIATTPGGAAVDLTTPITDTGFRVIDARQVRGWKFSGIEIRKKVGQTTEYNLVQIGAEENSRAAIPANITFDRVYIHGVREENGPRVCLFINAAAVTIVDSTIEMCNKEGEEGKAITFYQAPGPMVIRNNYIGAGSINLLTGGNFVYVENLISGDNGGITIEGNHFTRPLWQKYTAGTGGAGAPAGACTDDTFYLNISDGQWYKCASSAWAVGPTCAEGEYFRRTDVAQNCGAGACWACNGSGAFASSSVFRPFNYATKNLLEIKSAKDVVIRGNVFENNWINSDQSGYAVWLPSQVSQYNANGWVRGENIRFERNLIRYSTQGLRIASEGSGFGVNNNKIRVRDVLMAEIGTVTTYPSMSNQYGQGLAFAGPCEDCAVDHVSICCGATWGYGVGWDTAAFTRPRFADSIAYRNQYGFQGDGGQGVDYYWGTGNVLNIVAVDNLSIGTGSVGAYATNGKYISAGTTLYTGGGNYRLQTTSPYSAACASGCDYAATDGKDLGADIDAVESATGGAATGAPWLGGSVRVDVGSTKAIVRYTAPSSSACTVKLYTNLGRTTLHADTDTGGEQLDSRAGSITIGTSRQLVLGTNTALTAATGYWLTITCGSSVAMTPVTTVAAGATMNIGFRYASAITGEYSSNSDMSSPTAISSSATHTVPIGAGAVLYYRANGGGIKALTGR